MATIASCFLLVSLTFGMIITIQGVFDSVMYSPIRIMSISTLECVSNRSVLDEQLLATLRELHQRLPPPGCLRKTRFSCADILYCNSSALSGYYQIQATNGTEIKVYCDMQGTHCGGDKGWTRVAYLNMTDPSTQCSNNLHSITVNNTRFCVRNNTGCVPLQFETYGITYSKVCGFVRGYSFHTPDAFGSVLRTPNESLSGNYVDGVSITYDTPPRHIWTYAAGFSEDGTEASRFNCPCNTNIVRSSPSYVGADYYCESGVGGNPIGNKQWFTSDPLWDGDMCRGTEGPCCNHTTLPWFIKNLPERTSANIKVRLCVDQGTDDEDIGLERLAVLIK